MPKRSIEAILRDTIFYLFASQHRCTTQDILDHAASRATRFTGQLSHPLVGPQLVWEAMRRAAPDLLNLHQQQPLVTIRLGSHDYLWIERRAATEAELAREQGGAPAT
jgi:hypothetical protein